MCNGARGDWINHKRDSEMRIINQHLAVASLLLISLLSACGSEHGNAALDENFGRGHNGLLWGEDRDSSLNWMRVSKQIPIQLVKQSDSEVKKRAADFRGKYLKLLKLRSVPNMNDDYVATYTYLDRNYILNFDEDDRFSSVTFGPPTPAPPLTEDGSFKGTEGKFSQKVISPLVLDYGKPRTILRDKGEVVRKYWIWEGEKVSYVVELIFAQPKGKIPSFWQYSESILLSSPDYFNASL
jgi:hypothetical protein